MFEAVIGNSPDDPRSVALDDVKISEGACPPRGFCTFEIDQCSWYNSVGEGMSLSFCQVLFVSGSTLHIMDQYQNC